MNHEPGPPTEKTKKNVWYAESWGRFFGKKAFLIQPWTPYWYFLPTYTNEVLLWWEREKHRKPYKVRHIRFYWLRFGVGMYWEVKEK